MQINPDNLNNNYTNKNLYLLYGEEILLLDISLNLIRSSLKKSAFNQKIRFDVDNMFNWNVVYQELYNESLFSKKRVIECYLNITEENTNHILEIITGITSDICVIFIVSSNITKAQKNSVWFKSLDKSGVIISHYKLNEQQTKNWLKNKAQQLNLKINDELVEMIFFHNEGNLLALLQEIKKLQMIYGKDEIKTSEYSKQIEQQSQYAPYSLINAALLGDSKKIIKIKQTLQEQGVNPLYVINTFINELKTLSNIALYAQGNNIDYALKEYNLFYYKKNMLKAALSRHSSSQIQKMIIALGKIERSAKGYGKEDIWHSLSKLLIILSGKKIWLQ